jgi:hypothetical protein
MFYLLSAWTFILRMSFKKRYAPSLRSTTTEQNDSTRNLIVNILNSKSTEKQKNIKKISKNQKRTDKKTKNFNNLPILPVQLEEFDAHVNALIDSGANGNFISENLVTKLEIPVIRNKTPPHISVANASRITKIGYRTVPLCVNHNLTEKITFQVIANLSHDIILGTP